MGASTRSRNPYLTSRSVELLFELLDQPDAMLSGSAMEDFLSAEATPLIAAQLLKPHGHVATCTSAEGDDRPVALVRHEGLYGYFGASGWLTVEPERLTSYAVDVATLCRALVPDEKSPRMKELVPNLLWDIGAIRLRGRRQRVPIVLGRRVFDATAWRAIRKRLTDQPRADRIIVLASTHRNVPDDMPMGETAVFLSDVVEEGSLSLNLDALASRLDGRVMAHPNEPVVVIGGAREVRLYDKVFKFPRGDQQRRIVVAIHQRYLAGELTCSWAEVAAALDLPPNVRMRDYFKSCKPPVLGHLLREEGGLVGFCLKA